MSDSGLSAFAPMVPAGGLRIHDVAAHIEAMQVLNAIAAEPTASSGS
jgi:dihydropteroate synthase